MTQGVFPQRAGLAWDDPAPVETDPYRAFETAVRAARAGSHERKLDASVAKAFEAFAEALAKAVDLARVQQREIAALKATRPLIHRRERKPS